MSPITENPKPLKLTLMGRLRRYFLTGIVVTAPIAITIYLTYVFFTFVDQRVAQLLPSPFYSNLYGWTTIPGVGLLIAAVFFIIVGWFATNFLGRMIVGVSEYVVYRVPIINTVYKAIKQLFETVMGSQSQAFREVVLIEYPRKECWTLAFVTGIADGDLKAKTGDDFIYVFVPTAPSPVNGFLLFVPRKDVVPLTMTVEEGIKMVVSVGIVTPENPQPDKIIGIK